MKTNLQIKRALYALSATVVLLACQKPDVTTEATDDAATSATIAVAASASAATAAADSVYLVQRCGRGERRDSVAQSALPAAVNSYITAAYAGAAFSKAFAVNNSSGVATGYAVVIYYNNKSVGLLFDAAGTFVRVLEQRERGDLNGAGHHRGGRFEHRDGKQRDTVALGALPAAVTSYFAANHASDTLMKAFRNRDSGLVVISKANGLFATVFDAAPAFVKREQLPSRQGRIEAIELASLPSAAAAYLSQTYPNYVFKKAFTVSANGALQGYAVFIDANNTAYAVQFDATGAFVKAKTIH